MKKYLYFIIPVFYLLLINASGALGQTTTLRCNTVRTDGYYCCTVDSCKEYKVIVFSDSLRFDIFGFFPDDVDPLDEILSRLESIVTVCIQKQYDDYSEYSIENDQIKLRRYNYSSKEYYADWFGVIKNDSIQINSYRNHTQSTQPLDNIYLFKQLVP
jgi:hypothetical protein